MICLWYHKSRPRSFDSFKELDRKFCISNDKDGIFKQVEVAEWSKAVD